MAFIMHQVHAFNIQHCVDEPSKLVFGSLNRKKNSKILFEGFPVWPPHVKSNPWVVRPLQHKASQDWCSNRTGVYFSRQVVGIIVFGIIFVNWAKTFVQIALVFDQHLRLLCHDGQSSSLSYSGCNGNVLVPTCWWMEIHLGIFGSAQVWGENS